MSDRIENNIVTMKFDNKNFEKNANKSIKTTEKLKKSLDFKGIKKGLSDVEKASEKTTFEPLAKSADKVALKFSLMYEVQRRFFDKLAGTVESFAKSLSTGQIYAGLTKYEQKIEAIQQIMAAVGDSYDLKKVNDYVEKLAWFADETSYSITDMTSALAQFTSAGIKDLDEATASIMGISNWAARSGVNAQKAGTAFYNLSQAMSLGYLGTQDAKSLQLAGMMTEEFKNQAISLAKTMGKLDKQGKTKSGTKVTAENLYSTLSEKWFDKELMVALFAEYGNFSSVLQQEVARTGKSAYDILQDLDEGILEGYSKELVDAMDSVSYSAFKMGQESKTLSDAANAVKDNVSSLWSSIVESIVGDYEQAKKVWGVVYDDLAMIFTPALNKVKTILQEFNNNTGGKNRVIFLETLQSGFERIVDLFSAFREGWNSIFPEKSIQAWVDLLNSMIERFSNWMNSVRANTKTLDNVRKIARGIASIVKGYINSFKILKTLLSPLLQPIKTIASLSFDALSNGANAIAKVNSKTTESNKVLSVLSNIIKTVAGWINTIVLKAAELIGKVKTLLKSIKIQEALTKIKQKLSDLVEWFKKLGKRLGDLAKKIWPAIKWLFDKIKDGLNSLGGVFKTALDKVKGFFSGVTQKLAGKTLKEDAENYEEAAETMDRGSSIFQQAKDRLLPALKDLWERIKASNFGQMIASILPTLKTIFGAILSVLDGFFGTIKALFDSLDQDELKKKFQGMSFLDWVNMIQKVANIFLTIALTKAATRVSNFFGILGDGLAALLSPLGINVNSASGVSDIIDGVADIFKGIAAALLALVVATVIIGNIDPKSIAQAIGAVSAILGVISTAVISIIGFSKIGSSPLELNKVPKTIKTLSNAIFKIAIGLWLITKLNPEKLDLAANTLIKILAVFGALAMAIVLVSKIGSGDEKTANKTKAMIKALAKIVPTIATSLIALTIRSHSSKLNEATDALVKVITAITALAFVLGLFATLETAFSKDTKNIKSTSVNLKGISTTLAALALVLLTVFAGIAALTYVSKSSGDMLAAAGAIAIAIGALTILITTFTLLANFVIGQKYAGMQRLGTLLLQLTPLIIAVGAVLAVLSLVQAASGTGALVMAVLSLNTTLGVLVAVIFGLIEMTKKMKEDQIVAVISVMGSMMAIVTTIGAVLAVLAVISPGAEALASAGAIAIVLATLIGVVALLGLLASKMGSNNFGDIPKVLAAMAVAVVAIAGALALLGSIAGGQMIVAALGIGAILLAIVGAALLIKATHTTIIIIGVANALSKMAGAAAKVAIAVAAVIAVIVGVIAVIALIEAYVKDGEKNVVDIINHAIETVRALIPSVTKLITDIIIGICNVIKDSVGPIAETIAAIISALLVVLDDNIFEWAARLASIAIKLLLGVVGKVVQMIPTIIDYAAMLIDVYSWDIIDALTRLFAQLLKLVGKAVLSAVDILNLSGHGTFATIFKTIFGTEEAEDLAEEAESTTTSGISNLFDSAESATKKGTSSLTSLISGVGDKITTATQQMQSNVSKTFSDSSVSNPEITPTINMDKIDEWVGALKDRFSNLVIDVKTNVTGALEAQGGLTTDSDESINNITTDNSTTITNNYLNINGTDYELTGEDMDMSLGEFLNRQSAAISSGTVTA